jgi:uncharacterized protein (TIGR04141 family)
VLSNGVWYEIDGDFLSRLNSSVDAIQPTSVRPSAPKPGESEEDYNQRFAHTLNAICLDRQLITYGGGHSQIELCDIMTVNGAMLHVKHYASSASLSHLFAQGATAGRLLASDHEFRSRVVERFPGQVAEQLPPHGFDARDHEIGFVILGREGPASQLPLFSRVTLKGNVQLLRGFGYKVTLSFAP